MAHALATYTPANTLWIFRKHCDDDDDITQLMVDFAAGGGLIQR